MHTLTQRFKALAGHHDDFPAFHAAYIVGTLLAAAVLHTGFFAILIALHMTLDYVKYREIHGFKLSMTFKAMAMESIGDIALLLVSLTVGLYLSHVYVIAAFSGLSRSGLTVLRALGTVLPKMQIVEHMVAIGLNFHAYLHTIHPDLKQPLTRVQRISLMTIAVCTAMLLFAPIFYHGNMTEVLKALSAELAIMH